MLITMEYKKKHINTQRIKKFCNILEVFKVQFSSSWCFCKGLEGDKPHKWDAELAWYSPSTTRHICYYD